MADTKLDWRVTSNDCAAPPLSLMRELLGYPSILLLYAYNRLCKLRFGSLGFCSIVVLVLVTMLKVSPITFSCTFFFVGYYTLHIFLPFFVGLGEVLTKTL